MRLKVRLVDGDAAHLLTSQYAPAHGEDFRKKLNVLFKRHAKIDLTLPVEAWSLKKLMEQLEKSYKDRLHQLGQAYFDAYTARYKARNKLEAAQKRLDAIKDQIRDWQARGKPKGEKDALEKALWKQTMKVLPLEAALKQAEEDLRKVEEERRAYCEAA